MNKIRIPLIIAVLLFIMPQARAQTAVSLSPVAAQQFFSQAGVPLASGCIYTFISGTSTPQATYSEGTGTFVLSNPIVLDAGGFATIFLKNASYRFTIYSKGLGSVQGSDCFSGTFQRTVDNISAYSVINQAQNIFLLGQSSDPSGSAGELIYRSDIPCFRGFTTTWDCFVRLNDVQSFTNKTFDLMTNSLVNDAANLSGHYICNNGSKYVDCLLNLSNGITNYQASGAIAPVLNEIAKLTGSTITVSQTVDMAGFVGLCVANCSLGATSQIQNTGIGFCIFDGATTSGDYVQNSSTIGGNCRDSGIAPPSTPPAGQIIGRALSTNAVGGTYAMTLFPPEIKIPATPVTMGCTNFTPVTVSNNNNQQNLMSCTIPANALVQGSELVIDVVGVESTAGGAMTIAIGTSVGGGTTCSTMSAATVNATTNQPWSASIKFVVLTSGVGGTANMTCNYFGVGNAGGFAGGTGAVGTPTISINTALSNVVQIVETMSVANASNSITEQLLKAVIF